MQTEIPREYIDKMIQEMVDAGRIIEAGWVGLKLMSVPATAGDTQVSEMRKAFFAGAQHLYSSIMTVLEPGEEPTEKDLLRMSKIHDELSGFVGELQNDLN